MSDSRRQRDGPPVPGADYSPPAAPPDLHRAPADAAPEAGSAPTTPAPRPEDVGLTADQAREIYRLMVLTRVLDERMWLLNRQGKAPFVTPARGHEAAQVASARALEVGRDWVVTYYRDWGVALALGVPTSACLLSLLGKADDPFSGGRQLPGHFSAPELRLLSPSSAVATQIPHAVGLALAARLRHEPVVAAVYFGDGATSEGDFHEAANFAGIHQLPVIFICENNRYAISVPLARQMPTATVAERASAYGMPGEAVDGNDPLAVYAATRRAVERARAGQGPTLLEAETYRLLPHSSDDDDRLYRDPAEVAAWEAREPVGRYGRRLIELGLWTEAEDAALWQQARARLAAEAEAAERAPDPAPTDLLTHLYAEGEP